MSPFKRRRRVQRLMRWVSNAFGGGQYEEVVVKHDYKHDVPVATSSRVAAYYRQNGTERLTPRQRRRVLHKENAVRG